MWHPPPKKTPEKTNKQKTKCRERERNADGNQSWSDLCF